jgi:hypothetical protein
LQKRWPFKDVPIPAQCLDCLLLGRTSCERLFAEIVEYHVESFDIPRKKSPGPKSEAMPSVRRAMFMVEKVRWFLTPSGDEMKFAYDWHMGPLTEFGLPASRLL